MITVKKKTKCKCTPEIPQSLSRVFTSFIVRDMVHGQWVAASFLGYEQQWDTQQLLHSKLRMATEQQRQLSKGKWAPTLTPSTDYHLKVCCTF